MLIDFWIRCETCGDLFLPERLTFNKVNSPVAGILLPAVDVFDRMKHVGKGTAPRDAKRAERLGYTVREFELYSHIDAVKEIHESKPIRGGRPMDPGYTITDEQLAMKPSTEIVPIPMCMIHWRRLMGVFDASGRLRAYISYLRLGDVILYSRIIGHGDYLRDGIMYLLHREILLSMEHDPYVQGATLLMYGMHDSGDEGLQLWKRKNGFLPVTLEFK